MFLDDRGNDLFVCVVNLDGVRTGTTATLNQYEATWSPRGYLPLEIATSLIRLRTPSSFDVQDHLSESPIPLSGFPRGSKNQ